MFSRIERKEAHEWRRSKDEEQFRPSRDEEIRLCPPSQPAITMRTRDEAMLKRYHQGSMSRGEEEEEEVGGK